jgi:hypothetical protein
MFLVSWDISNIGLLKSTVLEKYIAYKTSVDFERNTLRYIQEDIKLPNHRCEDLKSYAGTAAIRVSFETAY